MAGIGAFMCFFGLKFIKLTLFLVGFVLVVGGIMALTFGYFVTQSTTDTLKWVIFGAACVLGLLIGYVISRKSAQKFAFFAVGALLGVILGSFLYSMFFVRWEFTWEHESLVLYGSYVVFGLICGIIGLVLTEPIEILTTSFFGSFVILRAVGIALDNYPSYKELADYIKNPSQFGNVPTSFYLYLGGTVVLAIIGVIFQWHYHCKHRKNRHGDPNDGNSELAGIGYQSYQQSPAYHGKSQGYYNQFNN